MRRNLWAPWRMKYIKGLAEKSGDFIESYVNTPEKDEENFVLWRTERCIVFLNRFPYNNGHLLITLKRKIADLDQAGDEELLEMIKLVAQSQKVLRRAVNPHGFNVGINLGRCAGAGVPEHMHIHIVPRWDGDTNFMHVTGHTDVISQGMKELYDQLREISREESLPTL